MMTLVWIILGVAVVAGLFVLFTSNKSDPADRAKDAATAAGVGAAYTAGCFLQMILSAIPIAIAILIVVFVMKSCSS